MYFPKYFKSLINRNDSLVKKVTVLFIAIAIVRIVSLVPRIGQAQSDSFTFTAAGDYGASSDATTVINGINPTVSGANLNLEI